MDLREFIKQSFVQIAQGISDANGELAETGAVINPTGYAQSATAGKKGEVIGFWTKEQRGEHYAPVTTVEFDVAVVASDAEASTQGGALKVWSLGFAGTKSAESQYESHSRIKFVVPVVMPTGG